jgi:hypothetical protein
VIIPHTAAPRRQLRDDRPLAGLDQFPQGPLRKPGLLGAFRQVSDSVLRSAVCHVRHRSNSLSLVANIALLFLVVNAHRLETAA